MAEPFHSTQARRSDVAHNSYSFQMNHRGANTATIPASNSHHGADSSGAGDPRELGKAKKYHGELLNLLDNLGGKLSVVSATVDKEFLASYRVHMLSVQSELRDLKNDVSKGEQMLNSDTQVAKLEKESKWFSGSFIIYY